MEDRTFSFDFCPVVDSRHGGVVGATFDINFALAYIHEQQAKPINLRINSPAVFCLLELKKVARSLSGNGGRQCQESCILLLNQIVKLFLDRQITTPFVPAGLGS